MPEEIGMLLALANVALAVVVLKDHGQVWLARWKHQQNLQQMRRQLEARMEAREIAERIREANRIEDGRSRLA